MTDRERLARRLCQIFWAYNGEPDRTAEAQWERESRPEGWLALADLILPALELPEYEHYKLVSHDGTEVMFDSARIKWEDWQAHVDAVKRVWGEE
jgi:hypothetical protein